MPLFVDTQMEKIPRCFVIDSDEDTKSESSLNGENGETNAFKLNDSCQDDDDPLNVNGCYGVTTVSPNNVQISNEDENNINSGPEQVNETAIDDFEFDFQSIDEAEQTEHILKVRVHANFCMRCGTGFVQQKRLNIHLEKNECSANNCITETPFTCSICGRGFFGSNCLRHHIMLHAQTKPFKCKKCFHSFVTQRDLYSHYATHKDYQPFNCKLCGKMYPSAKLLAAHKRDHAGERPYFCRVCPKRFNRSKNLNKHKRKHTRKKPFKCKFCKRRYGENSVRNIHMRTHTTSKFSQLSFLCEVCGLTHVRYKSTWIQPVENDDIRLSDDDDSVICLEIEKDKSEKSERKVLQPSDLNQRRIRRQSSDSVEIVEDPLQFTIDLVDE